MLFAEHQAQNDTLKRSTKNRADDAEKIESLAILREGPGWAMVPQSFSWTPHFFPNFPFKFLMVDISSRYISASNILNDNLENLYSLHSILTKCMIRCVIVFDGR